MMRWTSLATAMIALSACTAPLPTPALGRHDGDISVIVPYPPPPAKVDIVSKRPPAEVWIDGQWVWESRRWVWRPGGWEKAPPGGVYAPPTTVRLSDGTLAWFEGRWHVPASPPPPSR